MQAIESPDPVVLLIDEIDKAEPEFEAFLLEVLSDFQVTVPELGTIKAKNIPLVVLTSNNARELSDGLKRRCLHLFIDFPPPDEELAIIRLKVPEVSERLAQTVVTAVQRIRGLELRKAPSVSESLDWARSLVILNADALDRELVESTLTMLVKHEKDLERVKGALDKVLTDLGSPWTSGSLEFIGDLRRAELRISPSEALDALAASTEIGLESRETFKAALATTLVKESRDYATFDRIFDLYFLDLQALGSGLRRPSARRTRASRRCSTAWRPKRASRWTS